MEDKEKKCSNSQKLPTRTRRERNKEEFLCNKCE